MSIKNVVMSIHAQSIESLRDELMKIAVSENWIMRHSFGGTLERLTGASKEDLKSNTPFKTRKGNKRGSALRTVLERKYGHEPLPDKTFTKRYARNDAIDAGAVAYEVGQRARRLPAAVTKHWKKGVGALAATGLAAGAHVLHKRKKAKK